MGIHIMPPLFEVVIKPLPYEKVIINASSINSPLRSKLPYFLTWADMHDGVGTGFEASRRVGFGTSYERGDRWGHLTRTIVVYDVSLLNPVAWAKVKIVAWTKVDNVGVGVLPTINIFDASPADPDNIVFADYINCGLIPYSSVISYADWPPQASYAEFLLNASAREALNNAISGSGKFCISLREAKYDVADIEPDKTGSASNVWSGFSFTENQAAYEHKLAVWDGSP